MSDFIRCQPRAIGPATLFSGNGGAPQYPVAMMVYWIASVSASLQMMQVVQYCNYLTKGCNSLEILHVFSLENGNSLLIA